VDLEIYLRDWSLRTRLELIACAEETTEDDRSCDVVDSFVSFFVATEVGDATALLTLDAVVGIGVGAGAPFLNANLPFFCPPVPVEPDFVCNAAIRFSMSLSC
jgi:hypothetical protein